VRSAGSSLGLQTPNAGTAGYRAPEAGTHQRQPAPRLDVYAVAVMIYQLLEGACRLTICARPTSIRRRRAA
jgi:serine/threonine protein kinase